MEHAFSRTELLFGEDGMRKLANARVAVFGVGGVGGYVVEALARSGIGALDLVDGDVVAVSNLNRQIVATRNVLGRFKVDALEERVLSINPKCRVRTYKVFYLPGVDVFDFSEFDYIIDAVDTVAAKLEIVRNAKACGVPVISSMGAGNKLDPTAFRVADIYDTSVCPLARVMRRELKKCGVDALKTVYSIEPPIEHRVSKEAETEGKPGRVSPGSTAFTPSVCGLIIAGEVVKDIVGDKRQK